MRVLERAERRGLENGFSNLRKLKERASKLMKNCGLRFDMQATDLENVDMCLVFCGLNLFFKESEL